MILESDKKEYIFIYSDKPKIKFEYKDLNINNNKSNKKVTKFKIVNNIRAENKLETSNFSYSKLMYKVLKLSLYNEGFQIYTLKYDTLYGVIEGPPNTPYENGYFLFKMIFPQDFNLKPPLFSFITKIFHPNISENGVVSADVFQDQYSPILILLSSFIYSVMSLLDDPNPDIFINEIAAKQKKKIKMNMKKLLKNILLCLLIIQYFKKI
jgi:ubiquitin-protein ligase